MSYTTEKLDYIFSRGDKISDPRFPSNQYRKDAYGHIMKRCEYGKNTKYGWAVDRIIPAVYGGIDIKDNLQPMNYAKIKELGNTLNKKILREEWIPSNIVSQIRWC